MLRNKATGQVYLVVLFSLYLKEDINEDGTVKDGAAERAASAASGGTNHAEVHDEEETLKAAREELGYAETSQDDVD